MKKIPRHFRRFLLLMSGLLIIDLTTKYFFFDKQIGGQFSFIQPMFNLGASWSMQIPVFVSICVGWISLLLFILIYHKKYITWRMAALLIAGTLGNMIDRMMFGGVRDFLQIIKRFPVFNIADILLNFGIFAYFRKEFFTGKNKTKH